MLGEKHFEAETMQKKVGGTAPITQPQQGSVVAHSVMPRPTPSPLDGQRAMSRESKMFFIAYRKRIFAVGGHFIRM
jgi:hypothetical protein